MHLRLSLLTLLLMAAMANPALAGDHLTGTVTSKDRAKGTLVVRTDDDDEQAREVTIHMKRLPPDLRTGSLVRVSGRFLSDDHSRFEADRLKIKHDDPAGVRARLRASQRMEHEGSRQVIRIPENFKLPERSR